MLIMTDLLNVFRRLSVKLFWAFCEQFLSFIAKFLPDSLDLGVVHIR